MDVVYGTRELEAWIAPTPDVDRRPGTALFTCHRAGQESVIQFPVQIHVERTRICVVDAGHVVPGTENQGSSSVTGHEVSAGIREFEADRARASVNRGIQLIAEAAVTL